MEQVAGRWRCAGDAWKAHSDPVYRRDSLALIRADHLLPFVEMDGTILLIGATTENPYFEVNGALISVTYF